MLGMFSSLGFFVCREAPASLSTSSSSSSPSLIALTASFDFCFRVNASFPLGKEGFPELRRGEGDDSWLFEGIFEGVFVGLILMGATLLLLLLGSSGWLSCWSCLNLSRKEPSLGKELPILSVYQSRCSNSSLRTYISQFCPCCFFVYHPNDMRICLQVMLWSCQQDLMLQNPHQPLGVTGLSEKEMIGRAYHIHTYIHIRIAVENSLRQNGNGFYIRFQCLLTRAYIYTF